MKQEDKDLLLKDLCARLPYGVKIKTSYDKIDEPIELVFINPRNESFAIGSNFTLTSGLSFDIYECKPYLFPISSMSEEQKKEYDSIIYSGVELHSERYYDVIDVDYFDDLMDFYHKHHLDYRGLIPMGLANDATGLNIYSD